MSSRRQMKKKMRRHSKKGQQGQTPQKTTPQAQQTNEEIRQEKTNMADARQEPSASQKAAPLTTAPASPPVQPPSEQPTSNGPVYVGFLVVIAAIAAMAFYTNNRLTELEKNVVSETNSIAASLQESEAGTEKQLIANVSDEAQKIIETVQALKTSTDERLTKLNEEIDSELNAKVDQATERLANQLIQISENIEKMEPIAQGIQSKLDQIQTEPIADSIAFLSSKLEEKNANILSSIRQLDTEMEKVPSRFTSELQSIESGILSVLYHIRENGDVQQNQLQQLLTDYQELNEKVQSGIKLLQNELEEVDENPIDFASEDQTATQ